MLDGNWTVIGNPLWSAASFFAGFLLGHWLELGRDIRKEYNEVALRIRDALEEDIAEPLLRSDGPAAGDLETVRHYMRRWYQYRQRRKFDAAVSIYRETRAASMPTLRRASYSGEKVRVNIDIGRTRHIAKAAKDLREAIPLR